MKPVRVCIDARLVSGSSGGVEQFTIGLASGLSDLEGDDEYLFLAFEDSVGWIRPHLRGNCRLLVDASSSRTSGWKAWLKKQRLARVAWYEWPVLSTVGAGTVPRSNGLVERAGVDVVHFAKQDGFLTEIPSIYHPHDLQHLHLPELFTPRDRRRRAVQYPALIAQARMVAVASCWVKRDVLAHFDVAEEKVEVVPLAAPNQAYPEPSDTDLATTARELGLTSPFLLYPAQTWPHKNHIRLLRALALLRDRHQLRVPLVCVGQQTDHFRKIRAHVGQLGLDQQVRFLGFVSTTTLQSLYRLARAVVVPTLFEAASFPMMEAFSAGIPVASSNVTSLPEQAGDAALFFDPTDLEEMAEAIRTLWVDADVREGLVRRGRRRQEELGWEQTARTFRAHYRRLAGRDLSEEDRWLLSHDPCQESRLS